MGERSDPRLAHEGERSVVIWAVGLGSDEAQHEGADTDRYISARLIASAMAIDVPVMVASASPMTPRRVAGNVMTPRRFTGDVMTPRRFTSDVMSTASVAPAIGTGSSRDGCHGGGGKCRSNNHRGERASDGHLSEVPLPGV